MELGTVWCSILGEGRSEVDYKRLVFVMGSAHSQIRTFFKQSHLDHITFRKFDQNEGFDNSEGILALALGGVMKTLSLKTGCGVMKTLSLKTGWSHEDTLTQGGGGLGPGSRLESGLEWGLYSR